MNKIVILVLSCLEEPYYSIMKKQQETWDSIDIENIKTIYYYGGSSGFKQVGKKSFEYGANCSDIYKMMHWKFILTLKEIINEEWDYIFRTNTSSYIDKKRLLKFSENLPTEKCYCGINGGGFASGTGIFLSRDCVEIAINEFINHEIDCEDVYLGEILYKHNISVTPGAQRINFFEGGDIKKPCYHYRCKSTNEDREYDIRAMDWLFKHNTEK